MKQSVSSSVSGWIQFHSLSILLCLLFLHGTWIHRTLATDRPNFVFIIADDCTWSDLGVYGGQAKTPNLNRLAGEGMVFSNCFQAAPMCSPTRHCIYTGLYPVKSGAYPNHTFVKPGVRSIAHYLGDAGYRVALSGKTHINPPEAFPFEYSKLRGENNPDFKVIDRLFKESQSLNKPFCLFICSNEPHTPYTKGDPSAYDPSTVQLPPHYVDTQDTRDAFVKYLAEITYFDSQVGQCLELLDQLQLADNTLVMVVSEQGNSFPFAKWTCYEAGLKSGMIVRWPGKVAPGSRTDAMVEYVDVLPTFLEAAGVAWPKELDGRSFLPVLNGSAVAHKDYSYGIHTTRGINNGSDYYGIRTVRSNRYRYIRNLTPEARFSNAVFRTGWWKTWEVKAAQGDPHASMITRKYAYRPAEELYDCVKDPWNLENLADRPEFETVKWNLSRKLNDWMDSQGDVGQPTEMDALNRLWKNRGTAGDEESN